MHHQGFHPLARSTAAAAWFGVLLAVGGLGLLYLTTVSDPGNLPRGATSAARGASRAADGRKASPASQRASGAFLEIPWAVKPCVRER